MKTRGFGLMDVERRRAAGSLGGRRRAERGTGHIFSSDEARAAGRKGGLASGVARRARNGTPA